LYKTVFNLEDFLGRSSSLVDRASMVDQSSNSKFMKWVWIPLGCVIVLIMITILILGIVRTA